MDVSATEVDGPGNATAVVDAGWRTLDIFSVRFQRRVG